MKKYFDYLLIYSIGGFILERIINVLFYGVYYDNSVLIGPYQPLYGSGILLAILVKDFVIDRHLTNHFVKLFLLLIVTIFTTALVESITGYGFDFLFNEMLWDYREFFTCTSPYVCFIPTSIFGILSFLAIKYLHPIIESIEVIIPKYVSLLLFIIFILDIIYTFSTYT